jgi:hypothetical protein
MSVDIRCLCIVAVSILPIFCPAQIWVARYNGPGNDSDEASAITVDEAGNVYVTGSSHGSGTGRDYATVKYDSAGVEQWVARYNGPGDGYDWASAIAVDGAGNIYVTGSSYGSTTSCDYATVKYDSAGVEQWVARYDGPGNSIDYADAITLDGAGNVYVAGGSIGTGGYYDYATVKYNSAGVEQWVARYNGPGNVSDEAFAIACDAAGNVYATGWSAGSGTGADYATVKYDALGVEQWVVRYNGPGNDLDIATAIAIDSTGNIYVTGGSYGSGTWSDYATINYDSMGVEQLVVRYNGPGNDYDRALAITLDATGNIYVTGGSYGSGTWNDYATVKYDSAGVEQWVARYNGPGDNYDVASAIALDWVGNVYTTGYSYGSGTWSDYATVKYNSAGVEQWVARYDGPGNGDDRACAIAIDGTGNACVTGYSAGLGTEFDFATMRYSPVSIEENRFTVKEVNEIVTTIFSGSLHLPEDKKCKVFDIAGRIVEPDKIQPGIYFVEVNGVVTQKVVKVR